MTNLRSLICTFRRRVSSENGQILPMMALLMVGFFGLVAMVVDVGDLYCAHNELVASTNAAAMAGAEGIATSSTQATNNAYAYGSSAGEKNQYPLLVVSETNPVVTFGCVNNGLTCINEGAGKLVNAIQVSQTAKVRTYFAGIFGTPYVTINAVSTGLMGTPKSGNQNIAVIMDTTASMADKDSSCGKSALACALTGFQQLLGGLSPCMTGGCGSYDSSTGNYQNAADRVALFTFPELSDGAQATDDTNCSGNRPGITPYTFPSSTGKTYDPGSNQATYQVTGYLSNYQTVTGETPQSGVDNLNGGTGTSASDIVNAAGGGGCAAGMGDPGGEGTYYAGVLYAAQASLLAQTAAEQANGQTNISNAIIIISDGAATASKSQMASTANNSGTYTTTGGSYVSECQQAVTAANAIKTAGTTIYAIAYNSPSGSGCTTDSGNYKSPCYTMQQMAGNTANPGLGTNSPYFYSDDSTSGNCPSSYNPVIGGKSGTSLNDIFTAITASFGPPRLVPNADYPSS